MNNEQKPTTRKFVIGSTIGVLLLLLAGMLSGSAPFILSGILLLVAIWGVVYLYSGQVLNRSDKAKDKKKKWDEAFKQDSKLND